MVKDNNQENETRRILLLELQKEIQSLINNYLVKFGVDKTRGVNDKLIKSYDLSAKDCRETIKAGGECTTWIDQGNAEPGEKGAYEKYFERLFGVHWQEPVYFDLKYRLFRDGDPALYIKHIIRSRHDLESTHLNIWGEERLSERVDEKEQPSSNNNKNIFDLEKQSNIYGKPNPTNKMKRYGKNKDKLDPNMDKAQYNSIEMYDLAKDMKDKIGFINDDGKFTGAPIEGIDGEGTLTEAGKLIADKKTQEQNPLPTWLYFYMNQKESPLLEGTKRKENGTIVGLEPDKGIYLKLMMDAFADRSLEEIIQFQGGADDDLKNDYYPINTNLITGDDGKLNEKKKYIHYYNRFLWRQDFPNPLTSYTEPHKIPGKVGQFVDVTDETKTMSGKGNIVFAGWKQNSQYPDDSMDYIYIEITNAELKQAGNLELAKNEKFKIVADTAHKSREQDSPNNDPWYNGMDREMNLTKVCDLSYYLLFDELLYKGAKGEARLNAIKQDHTKLTKNQHKKLYNINYDFLNNHIPTWEEVEEEERFGRLIKISDEIDLLTERLNELLQNRK